MDNTANQPSEHSDRTTGETASTQGDPQSQPETRVLGALSSGIRQGAEDARIAAENALPKVKSAAAGAVYWTAYGVSFAAVFQRSLAKGLAPESLKSGVRDGVKAAEAAAQKWIEKLSQRKEKATDATPDQAGPSADAVQPGAA